MALGGKIFLAAKMLLHNRKRLAISIFAVSFSVLIMFMELGFFNGVAETQSSILAKFNGDLIMMDHKRTDLGKYLINFDSIRLHQALTVEGIEDAFPVYMTRAYLENPDAGITKSVLLFAFPAGKRPLNIEWSESFSDLLKTRGMLLFDKKSRKIYGPIVRGERVKLNGKYHYIAGFFELGPNFLFDGTVMVSQSDWLEGIPKDAAHKISYAFIKAKPGTDIERLRTNILDVLPKDVLILTPDELRHNEIVFTIRCAPLGAVFGVGLIVGFVIGVIICSQILHNEIVDHSRQYATLRAMGFTARYLMATIIKEALILSVLGFIPGFILSIVLYLAVERVTGILMHLTFFRTVTILILSVAMCALSGVLAARKVLKSDPAELY